MPRMRIHNPLPLVSNPDGSALDCGFALVRTWAPADRRRERQIKRQGGLSRSCPACGVTPRLSA
jgi:hypothetical protein